MKSNKRITNFHDKAEKSKRKKFNDNRQDENTIAGKVRRGELKRVGKILRFGYKDRHRQYNRTYKNAFLWKVSYTITINGVKVRGAKAYTGKKIILSGIRSMCTQDIKFFGFHFSYEGSKGDVQVTMLRADNTIVKDWNVNMTVTKYAAITKRGKRK